MSRDLERRVAYLERLLAELQRRLDALAIANSRNSTWG